MKKTRIVKKWKISDIRFIEDNLQTMTWSQIARKLDRKTSAVMSYCYRILRLQKYPDREISPPWTKEQDEMLVNFYHKITLDELSQRLGRTSKATMHRFYKLKLRSQGKKAA